MIERRYVSVKTLAGYLQVSKHTIYLWVRLGTIPHIRTQRLLRFDLRDIDAWLEKKKVKVGKKKQ